MYFGNCKQNNLIASGYKSNTHCDNCGNEELKAKMQKQWHKRWICQINPTCSLAMQRTQMFLCLQSMIQFPFHLQIVDSFPIWFCNVTILSWKLKHTLLWNWWKLWKTKNKPASTIKINATKLGFFHAKQNWNLFGKIWPSIGLFPFIFSQGQHFHKLSTVFAYLDFTTIWTKSEKFAKWNTWKHFEIHKWNCDDRKICHWSKAHSQNVFHLQFWELSKVWRVHVEHSMLPANATLLTLFLDETFCKIRKLNCISKKMTQNEEICHSNLEISKSKWWLHCQGMISIGLDRQRNHWQ